jgi:two-component system OmpR family sensor kinase
MSLRTKLIASLITLVIIALVVISFVSASILRGYLLGQTDAALKAQGLEQIAAQAVQDQLDGSACQHAGFELANAGDAVWWIPARGTIQQVVQPAANGMSTSCLGSGGPALSTVSAVSPQLVAYPGLTTTISGSAPGDRWRLISYSLPLTNGTNGTMIIGTDVSSVYGTIQRLIGVDLIVSIVIVFVLLMVGIAVVRANLRPLVDIEETAGEIADGHLNRRVPERDPRTEIGSLGRSLNIMLSQIEAAFHAREESEAAAHQSEERMRRFIADASHELRTPLTAIRGFAEYYRQRGGMVTHWDRDEAPAAAALAAAGFGGGDPPGVGRAAADGGLTPDDLDRLMQRVEKEAARMGLLVEDLLLLARLDQQRPLARQPVDLLSLAADAVHDTRLLAPDRTVDLSVQPGAAFLVIGDEPRLRQVIGNLMSNALTHTPDGTPIEVSIGSGTLDPRLPGSSPAVTLDVTDHGPGMTPEQAHRVFERFYRTDQARTRATGGSGLGLAIVNALVAAHAGVASVRTAPGKGATFRIALPLAPEARGGPVADDDPDLDEAGEAPGPPPAPADGTVAEAGEVAGEGEDIMTFGGKGTSGTPSA